MFFHPTIHIDEDYDFLRIDRPVLIVNKQNNKLAFIRGGKIVKVYPVATGKTKELTPEGTFTIIQRAKNPYYIAKNIPGGDPRNPLGTRWLGFDALGTDGTKYGIHGTNQPNSIGKYISKGCIRMYNKNVEELYEQVPSGSIVHIVRTPETFEQIGKKKGWIYP
ncbi:MAG: L,D-transpeptidase [Bacillaceae bacterium]